MSPRHMGADIAAYRTRSDNGYLPAHTFLPAFWATLTLRPRALRSDAGIVDHLRPFGHIRLHPRPELIRGTAEGSYPIDAIFSLRSGDATARAISRYKRSMISRGVPAGAQTH